MIEAEGGEVAGADIGNESSELELTIDERLNVPEAKGDEIPITTEYDGTGGDVRNTNSELELTIRERLGVPRTEGEGFSKTKGFEEIGVDVDNEETAPEPTLVGFELSKDDPSVGFDNVLESMLVEGLGALSTEEDTISIVTKVDCPKAEIDNEDTAPEFGPKERVDVIDAKREDVSRLATVDDLGILPPMIVERGEALGDERRGVPESMTLGDPGVLSLLFVEEDNDVCVLPSLIEDRDGVLIPIVVDDPRLLPPMFGEEGGIPRLTALLPIVVGGEVRELPFIDGEEGGIPKSTALLPIVAGGEVRDLSSIIEEGDDILVLITLNDPWVLPSIIEEGGVLELLAVDNPGALPPVPYNVPVSMTLDKPGVLPSIIEEGCTPDLMALDESGVLPPIIVGRDVPILLTSDDSME